MEGPAAASTPQPKQKRSRTVNYTNDEKALFVEELMPRYQQYIECKKTDHLTTEEKVRQWDKLQVDFNNRSPHYRTVKQLQGLWDNLKKVARKNVATDKKGLLKTGGGERPPSAVTPMDLKVLGALKEAGVGNPNAFDGDSEILDIANMPVVFAQEGGNIMNNTNEETGDEAIEIANEGEKAEVIEVKTENPITPVAWEKATPRMLYHMKPVALKVGAASTSANSAEVSALKTKSLAEEEEWAKAAKRRRPSLPANDAAAQLLTAKMELAQVWKQQMDEKMKREKEAQEEEKVRVRNAEAREQALFDAEKRKKDLEAQLLELQVLKMRKDLGLD